MSYADAQSIFNRVKEKVKNKIEQKIDEGIDKGLEKVEMKSKESLKSKESDSTKSKQHKEGSTINKKAEDSPEPKLQSYSKYDFIRGDQIRFIEDFSEDVIGEFPLKWGTNNRGETVNVDKYTNKWLRLYQSGKFTSPYIATIPTNYTLEFDMILNYDKGGNSYRFPGIQINLLALNGKNNLKDYLVNSTTKAELNIEILPSEEGSSTISLKSIKEGSIFFENPEKGLRKLDSYYGKPIHVAIWVQGQRLRLWINEEKVYDIPSAVPSGVNFDHIGFYIEGSGYLDEQIGYYLSNILLADAMADLRTKFINEGKIVTQGILFDSNSAQIKPESIGTLDAIAKIFIDNSTLQAEIIGHTDNEGDEQKNLDLSIQRSESVKRYLVNKHHLAENRFKCSGAGESKPIEDNKTPIGKAKNRRVEFIKL